MTFNAFTAKAGLIAAALVLGLSMMTASVTEALADYSSSATLSADHHWGGNGGGGRGGHRGGCGW